MYLDFIFKIATYIEKHYSEPSAMMSKKKFYKRSAECFVLNSVIIKCLDNQNENPLNIFDNLILEYTLAYKECIQLENKYLYLTFINALMNVRDFILVNEKELI